MNRLMMLAKETEARAWKDMFDGVGRETRAALRLSTVEQSGSTIIVAGGLDHMMFNRVIGTDAVDLDQLHRVKGLYNSLGINRYMLHFGDEVSLAKKATLARLGIEMFHRPWMKMWRGAEPAPQITTALEVRRVSNQDARRCGEILASAFDAPTQAASVYAAVVGRPNWHVICACDRGKPVGVGALFLDGSCGYLAFAATSPSHRGRGVQGALMATRIRMAIRSGCRWIFTETGVAVPGERNHSMNNMHRCGFKSLGLQHNFVPAGATWGQRRQSA